MNPARPPYGQIACFTAGAACLFIAVAGLGVGSSFHSGVVLMATGVALRAIDIWRGKHEPRTPA